MIKSQKSFSMTKLNYINRKSEGLKLGQIVAKDLRKRNKQSTPPKGDSTKDGSVDLLLDGKKLTDDGLFEMARGLEDALDISADFHHTRLRVLNLSGNDLTARSLSELAPSLHAAADDIEELDLSGNLICVSTADDLRHWEHFLESLRHVRSLTLLNLSGNDLAEPHAWETFTRNYGQQFHANQPALDLLFDENDDPTMDDFNLPEQLHALDIQLAETSNQTLGLDSCKMGTRNLLQGLPSISTIKISDMGLTDYGALFLSYSLAQHRWIQEHVFAKHCQGQGFALIKHGILHSPNDTLTPIGVKILKLAEAVSYELPPTLPPVPENSPMSRNGSVDSGQGRRISVTPQHARKASVTSPGEFIGKSPSGHLHTNAEDLDSLRKKIQRTILEDKGPRSIELWHSALRLLSFSRHVVGKQIIFDEAHVPCLRSLATSPISTEQSPARRLSFPCRDATLGKNGSITVVPVTPLTSQTMASQPTYASRLVVDTDPVAPPLGITSARPTPETPQVFRHPRHRRGSFSYHSNSSSPGTKQAGEARASVLKAAIRMTEAEPRLIGPLPARAWTIILADLADPEKILSGRQVQSVVNWARDKATLAFEMEALGKPDSVQIWRTLEGMGCLEYDGRD